MGKRTKNTAKERPKECVRLAQARRALKLTQVEMAAALKIPGVDQGRYKTYETRTLPTREVLAAVEKHLGLPARAFLPENTISDAEFNQIISEVVGKSAKKPPSVKEVLPNVRFNTDPAAEGRDVTEVAVGQNTLEMITGAINELKQTVAENRKAILELQELAKRGFRKGRH
jgi:transcriptional regulator with XRE-family HTH domain